MFNLYCFSIIFLTLFHNVHVTERTWSDLHFSEFQRVEIAFPRLPHNALPSIFDWTLMLVRTVHHCLVAAAQAKPKRTSIILRTIPTTVVSVFSAEQALVLITKRVTCIDQFAVWAIRPNHGCYSHLALRVVDEFSA